MKLLRIGPVGRERPAIVDAQGRVRDLTGRVADYSGRGISLDAIADLSKVDVESLPVLDENERIGSCIARPPNFYCIGLNYAKHAAEANAEPPAEPILFSKATSAVAGPNDPLRLPPGSVKCDWEVELGVVIGRAAEHVPESQALDHVAGYCVVNDVSERAYQLERGGQWIKGKSAPGFGPIGPWLVTADEVPDPQSLSLSMTLNGTEMQHSSTSDMIFSVREIISYMSRFMRLVPGDVIATGTPEGVGMGQSPQRFLSAGDVMELTVEGLGAQRQEVVAD